MSLHKSFTKYEVERLVLYGIRHDRPSQIADAFVLGLRDKDSHLDRIAELERFIESLQLDVSDDVRRCELMGRDW